MESSLKKRLIKDGINIGLVVICSIIIFSFMSQYPQGEIANPFFKLKITQDAIREGFYYPWSAHTGCGAPVDPELPFFGVGYFLDFFIDAELTIIYMVLFNSILSGICAYFLVKAITKDAYAGLIGAVLFVFSANWLTMQFNAWWNFYHSYPFMLLTVLFFYKFLKTVNRGEEKSSYINAMLTGLMISFMLLSGGVGQVFFTTGIFMVLMLLAEFRIRKALKKNRLFMLLAVGCLLILAVASSIAAFKVIGGLEYFKNAQSHQDHSYETFVWGTAVDLSPIKIISQIASNTRGNTTNNGYTLAIGTVGFLLILLSLLWIKKKPIMKMLFYLIVMLLISGDTFATRIIYLIPYINRLRDVDNFLIISIIPLIVLASFGYLKLSSYFRSKKAKIALPFIIVAAIAFVFLVFSVPTFVQEEHNIKMMSDDPFILYLLNDTSRYRVHMYKSDFVGFDIVDTTIEYGIDTSDWGISNVFFSDYSYFTRLAGISPQMPKLRGLLNDKYIVTKEDSEYTPSNIYWDKDTRVITEINYSSLKLLKKFEGDTGYEKVDKIYLNEDFLPREYMVNKSIALVAQDLSKLIPATIAIVSQDFYNPKKAVLLALPPESPLISKADIIIHDGSLISYPGRTGQHITTFSALNLNVLKAFFDNSKESIKEIEVKKYLVNEREYFIPYKGFAVLSERYAKFPNDWKAKFNSEKANIDFSYSITSAYYAEEAGILEMSYEPWYFKYGAPVGLLFMIGWIAVLIALGIRNQEKSE